MRHRRESERTGNEHKMHQMELNAICDEKSQYFTIRRVENLSIEDDGGGEGVRGCRRGLTESEREKDGGA